MPAFKKSAKEAFVAQHCAQAAQIGLLVYLVVNIKTRKKVILEPALGDIDSKDCRAES